MKLTELAVVEVDLSKYIDLIEKTEDQCLKAINNSPKVFVLTLIRNSTELQELGDTNEWESDLDVWKHVEDNYLKKDKTGGIDTKDLFKIVYTTLSEKYVKPKEPTKKPTTTTKTISGSNAPKELTFDLNEGLMGEEIQYDKKTILSKSQFEAKIKEENGENKEYEFEYTLNQAKVLIKPLSKETKEEKVEETKETKEDVKMYYVDTLEKDDDDDEDQFIIITPEKTELPKDEDDEESEPLTFDTEEEAEQLVKELNKSLLEKLNGDTKPKKEKKKKEPKVKKEKETKEEVVEKVEDVEVKKEKKEEVKKVTVEADDEDDFDW